MSPPAVTAEDRRIATLPEKSRRSTIDVRSSLWACLLLSTDPRRRRWLRKAATDAGWEVAEFHSVSDSAMYAVRNGTPLAVLDLPADARLRDGYDDLMRVLRSNAKNLVVICGSSSEPQWELWARQHGAWMYLPDTTEQDNLVQICAEAKAAAEKLRGAAPKGASN